ncbi:MAG: hypothetical protein PVH88_02170 [Ignavibacteria bacterium]|jgi:hypothetical protein
MAKIKRKITISDNQIEQEIDNITRQVENMFSSKLSRVDKLPDINSINEMDEFLLLQNENYLRIIRIEDNWFQQKVDENNIVYYEVYS